MQLELPVRWHATLRSGHGLVERMMARRSQGGALEVFLGRVVPEPVLAWLVALDDWMAGIDGMVTRVLTRRRVATANMAAMRAAAQVEPPRTRGVALDAARAARR